MGTRNRSLDSDARAAAAGRADHIKPVDESSVAEVLSALGGSGPPMALVSAGLWKIIRSAQG